MTLTENNIKAELSYAYLHAVAARAGVACEVTGRHSDAVGVDATLRVSQPSAPFPMLKYFAIDVQLKATSQEPTLVEGWYSFWLPLDLYDRLRETAVDPPRLLAVLFLPADPSQWLLHSEEALIARRCAYWVSLCGAPPSENKTGQTVYLPQANFLSVAALQALLERFARKETIPYAV
jgi:hypothetical protein